MNYQMTIGIEIHMELNTKTKMFSGAPYHFKKEANTCTNEVDLALPGTLPCVNQMAVKKAIEACAALNLKIDPLVCFDRKNYYYSDLPKGYQITQQFHPIGRDGYLMIKDEGVSKKIRINRIHMEEDTAKQFHLHYETLIDFNRAGVPLIEIVSEPDMHTPREAALYVEKLRQIMTYIGVSEAKMEEGSMRCDINVSLARADSEELGVKVEIKNLNSIANIETALKSEYERQSELYDKGETITQDTRRFDEKSQTTVLMRHKEGSIDYKYFPEPNIFPIALKEDYIKEIIAKMDELPDVKLERYEKKMGLNAYDANTLLSDKELANFFDETMKLCDNAKLACNMLVSEIQGLLSKLGQSLCESKLSPGALAKIVKMVDAGEISSKQAKEVLSAAIDGADPSEFAQKMGLKQNSNEDEILKLVLEVLDENPQSISDFKNGKDRAMGYLVGQVMKKSKGQANPALASRLVKEELAKR